MIKKFSGYDNIQVFDGGSALEPGGYELKIIGAKVEKFTNCEVLKVAFDIAAGDNAGFFKKRFDASKAQNNDAKWSGIFDVFLPKDDGSELDNYTKQSFKRFITSVEKSNDGYTWNWNEASLKGKFFGGVFGREQFETKDGKLKFATKCRFARSIESIRSGNFTVPEDKLLYKPVTESAAPDVPGEYEEILTENDLPF